jgi:putative transcriptional regulator
LTFGLQSGNIEGYYLVMAVERRLKEVRRSRGISQPKLAVAIGMSTAAIRNIEYGRTKAIPDETLGKLCAALKCAVGDILVLVPDPRVLQVEAESPST